MKKIRQIENIFFINSTQSLYNPKRKKLLLQKRIIIIERLLNIFSVRIESRLH